MSDLRNSNLASLRLRAAVALEAFDSLNPSASIGDSVPKDGSFLIVCKIGADDIVKRSGRWLNEISSVKDRGGFIALDYTDHHLGQQSVMRDFYCDVLKYVDIAIVPSNAMSTSLQEYWSGETLVIPDALEYEVEPPRNFKDGKPSALWFGHPSNLEYLVKFLRINDLRDVLKTLIVCTDNRGIQWIRDNTEYFSSVNLTLVPWAVQTLKKAALQCDLALLPVGLNDPRKSGASENRLVTALCLGLPVVTHSLLSYKPYRKYYSDIDEEGYMAVIKNPWGMHKLVLAAQRDIIPKYYPSAVGLAWRDFILKFSKKRLFL